MIPKTQVTGTEASKIRCDTCKVETFVSGGHEDDGIRAIAARSGWQTIDGKDYCPAHRVRLLNGLELLSIGLTDRPINPEWRVTHVDGKPVPMDVVQENAGVCRVCGCTDDKACLPPGGPCYWVEADLCSACRPEVP